MNYPIKDLTTNSLISITNDGRLSLDQVILLLSQEHDEETVLTLTRKFCLQTTSADISKKGMEFLYINGFFDDLQLLINKNKQSIHQSNRNWAEMYQLVLDRKLRQDTPQDIIQRLNFMKLNEPELKCIAEFIKITVFFDLNEYGGVANSLEKINGLIEDVDDQLLLSYFNIRLYQLLFIYYWTRNELIMARKYAFRVLNQSKNYQTIANVHINLGLTYTFDTYFQGMYHFSEALKIAKEHNMQGNIIRIEKFNIPFLSAHFNKTEGITTSDKSEQAHLEIARGNEEKAVKILHELPMDSPFQLYYMGMAKHDKNLLLRSYNDFIDKRSDYFFSRLPLNALKDMDA